MNSRTTPKTTSLPTPPGDPDPTPAPERVTPSSRGFGAKSQPFKKALKLNCDYCVENAVVAVIRAQGLKVTWKPRKDPRNPNWLLTDLVASDDHPGHVLFATVACPSPQFCVCDRPPTPGKQVYGNSSDPAWPHKCPDCGYHAAVVANDGVTVIMCRAAACKHSVWKFRFGSFATS